MSVLIKCGNPDFVTLDGDEVSSVFVDKDQNFQISFTVDITKFSCSMINSGDAKIIEYLGSESTIVPHVPDLVETRYQFTPVSKGSTSVSFNCKNDSSDTVIDVVVQ